jgi:sugar O-acyltransferase (sialic acid O-acetyltransferase NeuD family)
MSGGIERELFDSREETQVEPVAVIGAGGHGKVVVSTLLAAGIPVDRVYDDAATAHRQQLLGIPVVGPVADLRALGRARCILGVGDNAARKRLAESLPDIEWVTAVHPSAVVAPDVRLGPGSIVFAGAVIQPGVVVGDHVIVNTGATVDHDCRIADYAHIGPGSHLSGNNAIAEGAFLGTGVSTIQGVTVGAWSTVGVGAAVVRDIPPRVVASGVPARVTRQLEE